MRLLVTTLLLVTTPALAEPAPTVRNDRGAVVQSFDSRPLADCPRTVFQHTRAPTVRAAQPLATLPPAYRLPTLDRSLNGCAVYPEAQKVSDRSGKLAGAPPSRR